MIGLFVASTLLLFMGSAPGPSTAFQPTDALPAEAGSSNGPLWLPLAQISNAPDPVRVLPEFTQWAIDRFMVEGGRPDSSDCVQFGDILSEGELFTQKLASSLEAVVESATNVLVGRVTQVEPGLWYGSPASIATIEVTEWLRAQPELRPGSSQQVFVVYPKAELNVGRFRLCASDSRWKHFPSIGERVALISLYPPRLEQRLFELGTLPLELVLEDKNGLADMPLGLERSGAVASGVDFDVFVSLLRGLAAKSP